MELLAISFLAVFSMNSQAMLCKSKGCLVKRNSKQVIIYFRGHVKGLGGKPGRIPSHNWVKSAKRVLQREPYRLKKYNVAASLYATGSSHLSLSNTEIRTILKVTGAKSHYIGLSFRWLFGYAKNAIKFKWGT